MGASRSAGARLLFALGAHGGLLAAGTLAAVVLAAANAAYPVALELLTARLMDAPPLPARWATWLEARGFEPAAVASTLERALLPGFAALVIAKGLSQAARMYLWGLLTQRVLFRLRAQLFERLIAQSPSYHARQRAGDLVARLGPDAEAFERAVSAGLPVLLFDSLKLGALAAMTVVQYPGLLVVGLAALGAAVVPIVLSGRWLKRLARRGQRAQADLMHRVVETAGGISVVQAYDAGTAEAARFGSAQRRYLRATLRALQIRAVHTPLMEVVGIAAVLATLHVATTSAGTLQPSEAVGFLLAMVLMYEPLKSLARVNGVLMPGLAAAERIYEVLDRSPAVLEPRRPRRWSAPPDHARLEGVWFRYDDDGPDVLRGLDLRLRRGRVTGLVGPSGSGKSTAAGLLPRLYDVHRGRVVVGGLDVRALSLAALRSQIAIVTQDTFLFHASVRDNIAYGVPEARDADIVAAARRAMAHELIEALPEGYATLVGDRGARLSGGQRQRIAIARAFLKDAPLLILDEATSALDTAQEQRVQAALQGLMEDRAVLLIAHRPSTIQGADEIVRLDGSEAMDREPRSVVASATDEADR